MAKTAAKKATKQTAKKRVRVEYVTPLELDVCITAESGHHRYCT